MQTYDRHGSCLAAALCAKGRSTLVPKVRSSLRQLPPRSKKKINFSLAQRNGLWYLTGCKAN